MSATTPLTTGAVRIMTSLIDTPPDNVRPMIVQVIDTKTVPHSNGKRFRAVLSDGTHYVKGMLASQINGTGVKKDCIIRLDDYIRNEVSNRHVIILLAITVLEQATGRIGTPINIETVGASGIPTSEPQPLNEVNRIVAQPIIHSNNPNNVSSSGITTIGALNMYNNRWTILARLIVKTNIKTWSNAKGEGTLFSVELSDTTLDIRATFFKEAVDKFYTMLKVGNVYTLSGGRVKMANAQYNTCKSQYEITFDQNSVIRTADDDGSIAMFDFKKISDVEHLDANKNIDVLAIVKSVSEPANLICKKTGKELVKCDITLIDDTGYEISLTIWGEKARTAVHEMAGNPVVAFRRARVGDYNGKTLSAGTSNEIRPNIPAARQLADWWEQTGRTMPVQKSLSVAVGGKVDTTLSERKSIGAIKQENMGQIGGDKAEWLTFKATLTFIKNDKDGGAWYTACANAGEPCKNRFKCTQTTDNQWYCEKCRSTYPNPVRRWIFSAVVEDSTSSTWVSFFNDQAEVLLGMTADECYRATYNNGELDRDAYDSVFAKVFAKVLFTEWIFKCKVKNELYNGENRIKTSVYSMSPVDDVKESNDLMAALEQL